MDAPFEEVSASEAEPLGLKILYHRGYDTHYIRSEGEEKVQWYENTLYGSNINELSKRERDALEEQYQEAK
ncbi:hypothetical protein [Salinibacter ruber]|uniref:Collagenase-like PrtC family protease n=1 Tax=Salinibacter ruber TaxID=146919 RepID=A0A9X2TL81_9BACT|nr:hypothetical protein [Salinibacter ruber]MCS3661756.1 collagenase-like PrtC family protease [Salinibacter ruber]MCS3711583.1 collagenase-like PrtC family protease [Salinibacter ruber]